MDLFPARFPTAFLKLLVLCAQTGGDFGEGFGILVNAVRKGRVTPKVLKMFRLSVEDFDVITKRSKNGHDAISRFKRAAGITPQELCSDDSPDKAKWAAILALIVSTLDHIIQLAGQSIEAFPERTLAQHLAKRISAMSDLPFPWDLSSPADRPTTTAVKTLAPVSAATFLDQYQADLASCDLGTRTLLAKVPAQVCLVAGISLDWATASPVTAGVAITVHGNGVSAVFVDLCPFLAFAGAIRVLFLESRRLSGSATVTSAVSETAGLAAEGFAEPAGDLLAGEDSRKRAREASGETASAPGSPSVVLVSPTPQPASTAPTTATTIITVPTTPNLPGEPPATQEPASGSPLSSSPSSKSPTPSPQRSPDVMRERRATKERRLSVPRSDGGGFRAAGGRGSRTLSVPRSFAFPAARPVLGTARPSTAPLGSLSPVADVTTPATSSPVTIAPHPPLADTPPSQVSRADISDQRTQDKGVQAHEPAEDQLPLAGESTKEEWQELLSRALVSFTVYHNVCALALQALEDPAGPNVEEAKRFLRAREFLESEEGQALQDSVSRQFDAQDASRS